MTRHDFLEARGVILSNVLTFGKFSVSRKPIINGRAIRPVGLLLYVGSDTSLLYTFLKAIGPLLMEILHSKDLGDTSVVSKCH